MKNDYVNEVTEGNLDISSVLPSNGTGCISSLGEQETLEVFSPLLYCSSNSGTNCLSYARTDLNVGGLYRSGRGQINNVASG
jgi:hypothetical protein